MTCPKPTSCSKSLLETPTNRHSRVGLEQASHDDDGLGARSLLLLAWSGASTTTNSTSTFYLSNSLIYWDSILHQYIFNMQLLCTLYMYITAQVILHNITFAASLLASDYQKTSLKYTHQLIYGSFTQLLRKVNLIRAYYSPFCCALSFPFYSTFWLQYPLKIDLVLSI